MGLISPSNAHIFCLDVGWGKWKTIKWQGCSHVAISQFSVSVQYSSVQSPIVSEFLQPHGLQYTRLPCPSPTPEAYTNSCPLHRWCHPTISSSVILFSSHLNFTHHQGLFQWISFSQQVTKVLEFQLQHQSFQWIVRTNIL